MLDPPPFNYFDPHYEKEPLFNRLQSKDNLHSTLALRCSHSRDLADHTFTTSLI